MNDSAFDIGEIFDAFRRRAWLLVASIVVLTPIGLLVALLLPPSYSSTARILVQSQQIPNDLVRTTVEVAASERLALIQQRLTTRSNLLQMADRLQLYENQPRLSRTEIVAEIRGRIDIEEIALAARTARRADSLASAFTVTYRAESPVIAARVANELVTMVLRDNIENRSRRATETREFLQKKKEDLETALTRAEAAIADFKAKNADALPETLGGRQDEMLSVKQRVFELETQRLTLDAGRRDLQDAIERGLPVAAAGGRLSPAEQQLEALKRQLAESRGVFSDSHPKVRNLRASIASLEASIAAESGGSAGPGDAASFAKTELGRRMERVQGQIDLLDNEIAKQRARIEELNASIARTPDVEIALDSLTRERDDLANQLRVATVKEAQAADGEILEVNRQAERFEILEQAQIPEEPDSPPRKLISFASFGGSVVFGLALIVLAELLNRTIRTTRGLISQVGIAPIVAIPLIRTAQETTKRRVSTAVYLLLLLALGALFLFLIDQYVAPLDRLLTNVMDDANLTPLVEEAREKVGVLMQQGKGLLRGLIGG